MIFSASQVVGKTLYGNVPVKITRVPSDGATVVHVVPVNTAVGVVASWVMPKAGRTNLWWEFDDMYGRTYYAEHLPGKYKTSSLQEQGALTVKEEIEVEKAKAESTKETIVRMFKLSIGVLAGVLVIKEFIKAKK